MRRRRFLSFLLAFILLFTSLLPGGHKLVQAQDIDASGNEISSEEAQTNILDEIQPEDKKEQQDVENLKKKTDSKKKKESKESKNLKKQEEKLENKGEEEIDSLEELAPKDDKKVDKNEKDSELGEEEVSDKLKDLLREGRDETTNYSSSIIFPPGMPDKSFYGAEVINLYNQVSLSGNTTILAPGSYTKIYLPKDKFQKPHDYDINTTFSTFKDLEILETEDDYVIKTSYKLLAGGHNGATPFNVSLLPRETPNTSINRIRQEFYDADDNFLCDSFLDVKGRAKIENPGNYFHRAYNLEGNTTENYIVKKGTNRTFPYDSLHAPTSDHNDPRDRRVNVKIPQGLSLVDPNNDWTYDEDTDTYYRDVKRDDVGYSTLTATVDLGSLDLSDYHSKYNSKRVQLTYSISVVENGVVQDDISPNTWTSTKYFYAPIIDPTPPDPPDPPVPPDPPKPPVDYPAYTRTETYRSQSLIDRNYKAFGNAYQVYLPYEESLLGDFRMKFSHKAISYFYFNRSKDKDDPELTVTSTKTEVTGYTYPSELRININTNGLTSQEVTKLTNKLKNTRAYGIKYDGSKE